MCPPAEDQWAGMALLLHGIFTVRGLAHFAYFAGMY